MSFLKTEKSTILITGGASGIGLAMSKKFIELGHTVIAAGRRQAQLDLARSELPNLHTIQADVSTDEGRIALFDQIIRDFPEINVIFNNAGVNHNEQLSAFQETTPSDWELRKQTFATNTEAPMHLSALFLSHLLAQSNGLIVNNTSLAAYIPLAHMMSYSASKGECCLFAC